MRLGLDQSMLQLNDGNDHSECLVLTWRSFHHSK